MDRSTDHLPTLAAIAAVAYVVADVNHELVGHGGACVLMGGELRAVSSAWLDCDRGALGPWQSRAIYAAGSAANLLLGALLLPWIRRVRPGTGAYALWLVVATNLFMGGGYLMTSPLFGFGDFAGFLMDLEARGVWRFGLSAAGVILSGAALFVLLRRLDPWLGADERARVARARRLCWFPYAVGGLLITASSVLNPLGANFIITTALAVFGGQFFLAWMPAWVKAATRPAAVVPIAPSPAWLAAGALAALLVVLVLGPGIPR